MSTGMEEWLGRTQEGGASRSRIFFVWNLHFYRATYMYVQRDVQAVSTAQLVGLGFGM